MAFAAFATLKLADRRRYDVIQVHTPPDFLLAAAFAQRARGARLVLDVHDLSSDMFAMRFGKGPGAQMAERMLRLVERTATRLADAVITVHEPYRTELERRGTPAQKVAVLMNSVDEEQLPTTNGTPSETGAFRVVYHGTITPPYGVDLLVSAAAKAAARIPNLALEVYGEGDGLAAVERLAAKVGPAGLLHANGRYLPHREVLARVSGAAVGVIPNRPTQLNRFALSSKLFEYVALGIPVAVAELPTLRAHFSDDEVRFFRAGDDSALAEALIDIAANPDDARRRAQNARSRYEAYSWPNQAQRYVALLDRLAT